MKNIIVISAAALLLGCESAPPTIQTGPNAEVTFDGLVRVDNASFQNAWVDPEIDLSTYDKILPGGADFQYKAAKKGSTIPGANSSQREFAIDSKDQQQFEQTVIEVFEEELAKSKYFTEADTPGPDTLVIRGGMLDIVSRIPPESTSGMHEIYVSTFGEVTLVLEIVDSMSGEVLARAVERRALQPAGAGSGQVGRATGPTVWAEVRRQSRRWGTILREGLDSFHETANG